MILYSTSCPRCNVLIKKLESKKIQYSICSDIELMLKKGIKEVPYLEKDGKLMDFKEANNYINSL